MTTLIPRLVACCFFVVGAEAQVERAGVSTAPDAPRRSLAEPAPGQGTRASLRIEAQLRKVIAEQNVDSRLQALVDLAKQLTPEDIPVALGAIPTLPQLRERFVWQEAVLNRWGELNAADAFEYVAQMPEGRLKSESLRAIGPTLVKSDLQRAARITASLPPGASRNDMIRLVAHAWAEVDPAAALLWSDGLQEGFPRQSAVNSICYVWARKDPVAAATLVVKLPPGGARNDLIANVAHGWAARSPISALKWLDTLPGDEPNRDAAHLSIVEVWANQSPQEAIGHAAGLPVGGFRIQAITAAVSIWAKQFPVAAADWAWSNDDAEVRERGLQAALEVWAPIDPAAAAQWLAAKPAGPRRDPVVVAYINSALLFAPEIATACAQVISDPDTRARAVEQCLAQWDEVDPEAARVWRNQTARPKRSD